MYLFIRRENTIVFLAGILCYNNATFMQSLLQLLSPWLKRGIS